MKSKMPSSGKASRILGKRSDPGQAIHIPSTRGASSQGGPMGKLPAGIKNSKTVHQK